jgi:hypothetical protein
MQVLYFSPYKYIAKILLFKFLFKKFCQLLDSFAKKGGNFLQKDVSFSLSYGGKFADL